ncbi:ABC transporter substrate-binding protein [Cyclobacterium sp.]|uniref:ABC transporter substrate-binding protein n=1 Tax=Cyclobacterium sp. TaxID=1966343 RepID=UPI0019A14815|nr:ABC transporter substrate-binding protein [Cyclobacterium sp.]MBD3629000.1 ABC transporter substrate-binding protein [Cyclobacterium sp.]
MLLFKPGIVYKPFIAILWIMAFACSEKPAAADLSSLEKIPMSYARGFSIYKGADFYLLEIGPEQESKSLLLVHEAGKNSSTFAGKIDGSIPVGSRKIILTATTQIPHLSYLGAEEHLMAFPNLDLISSMEVRKRIEGNEILDLGKGPSPDLEKIIAADPDWVMVSGFGEAGQLAERLKAADIPVIVNGEFLEKHPLGRSEWIKLTGILLGKPDLADSVFDQIEKNYREALSTTGQIPEKERPTVLSGNLYKDIWYAPSKDSWAAQIIQDAGGQYLFGDLGGNGSLMLNYEFVLEKARDASYWIGASDFKNLGHMLSENPKYGNFEAFKNKQVYTYTLKKGETGGLMYFEEGYLRPDWVLMDMIKILHPEKAITHDFQYFQRLDE